MLDSPVPNTTNDIHPSVRFGDNPTIRNFIFIARDCVFGHNVRISNYCNFDYGCRIGNNVNFQTGVYLPADTEVGDNSFLSVRVSVADEKYPAVGPQVRRRTIIGRNVVIGMGAIIMGGVTIGDNAVVGMGAIVTKDVPAGEVWAGNPAEAMWVPRDPSIVVPPGEKLNRQVGRKMTRADYDAKKKVWEDEASKTA